MVIGVTSLDPKNPPDHNERHIPHAIIQVLQTRYGKSHANAQRITRVIKTLRLSLDLMVHNPFINWADRMRDDLRAEVDVSGRSTNCDATFGSPDRVGCIKVVYELPQSGSLRLNPSETPHFTIVGMFSQYPSLLLEGSRLMV